MNRHRFRARDYVEHMLDACIQIQTYIAGKTEADFLSDGLLQDGVVRRLEILGEASRQLRDVLPDAEARFPSIPFRTMYATRNQLIHGYIFVNYGVIWGVAHDEIPRCAPASKLSSPHGPLISPEPLSPDSRIK